jgi:dihydrofolate reductase
MYHKIEMIVAMNEEGLISGVNNIPWNVPEDMAFFRKLTMDNIVIMGRKTWESLPSQHKPLRGRINIIMTREALFKKVGNDPANGVYVVTDIAEAWVLLNKLHVAERNRVFVIGGREIYRLFLPICEVIHVTEIDYTDEPVNAKYFPLDLKTLKENWRLSGPIGEWQMSSNSAHTSYRFYMFKSGIGYD